METTKDYYEKIMQDYKLTGKGRSLSKYCREEGIDYQWLLKYKVKYPHDIKKDEPQEESQPQSFIALNLADPVKQLPTWTVARLVLESPSGDKIEINSNNLHAVSELLSKMS